MLRQLHKFPGLIAAILIIVLALSGTVLSVFPALNRTGVPAIPDTQISVAQLAGNIVQNYPGVEQIIRKPSGRIVVYYFDNGAPGADVVNPATGARIADYEISGFVRFMTQLHRSLFLDDSGRMVAGLGAFSMLVLTVSGTFLMAKRLGGWRKLFVRVRGSASQRLHVRTARLVVLGLLISALTALYLSLTTFGVISDGFGSDPVFPRDVNGGPTMQVADIAPLKDIRLNDFRELSFPYDTDPTDVFAITTSTGSGYIDQATGEMLSYLAFDTAHRVYEFVYMLHTGKGLWWLGLLLGASALGAPVLAGTGMLVWWRRRRALPKIAHNNSAAHADMVILVGSQGNSTLGFANALHQSLHQLGHKVHTAPMNRLAPAYRSAKHMFILTATYGEGEAPESAKGFLKKLEAIKTAPDFSTAVLGFGDMQFPKFCAFAREVSDALAKKNWPELMGMDTIDRQSAQQFARWGQELSKAMDASLELDYSPAAKPTKSLRLISRSDYGAQVQAPTAILRFAPPEASRRSMISKVFGLKPWRFKSGDLIGIMPPGSELPRYYSLASSTKSNVLEICVRKHPGGLCSEFLHSLMPGDSVDAFIQPNPDFSPEPGRAPLILIGAGTGIGPLAGFIRDNHKLRPMHLYFGGRDPRSDYLYQEEISAWLNENRLHSVVTAFSRVQSKTYVQDRIIEDQKRLRDFIEAGAHIMVCGGRDMAAGVKESFQTILAPMGLDTHALKSQGRYLEDVY